jgi:RNA polymerase primary sigma factor
VVRTYEEGGADDVDFVGGIALPEELDEYDDADLELDDADEESLPEERVAQTSSGQGNRELSALSAFQRSADRFPQLTPQAQLALAVRYHEGEQARARIASERLGKREREKLQQLVYEGERAMEHLCASCWRLAWLIVREQAERRFGRDKATDLLPDLMQEANGALVQAVREFDSTRTPTFHTYAAQVVRNHTRMVLGRDGYLRLAPAWVRVKRITAARLPELTTELGRTPTKEELQQSLLDYCLKWADQRLTPEQQLLPEPQKQDLRMAKLRKQGMLGAIRDIDDVMTAAQSPVSLDAPVGAEGSATLGDLIPGQAGADMFDTVELNELRRAISRSLEALTDRERDVIIRRFGLDGGDTWTCAMLGERFGVSSERIRQVERAALAKLASPHGQFASLSSFLPGLADNNP